MWHLWQSGMFGSSSLALIFTVHDKAQPRPLSWRSGVFFLQVCLHSIKSTRPVNKRTAEQKQKQNFPRPRVHAPPTSVHMASCGAHPEHTKRRHVHYQQPQQQAHRLPQACTPPATLPYVCPMWWRLARSPSTGWPALCCLLLAVPLSAYNTITSFSQSHT